MGREHIISITAEEIKAADNLVFRSNKGEIKFRRVKHGEWLYHTDDLECNLCHKYTFWETDYCPHCGADMRERKETNGEDTNTI